jgi:2'-5' RNA ligase
MNNMSELLKSLITNLEGPKGVYVGAKVDPFITDYPQVFKSLQGLPGEKVTPDKLHVTIIYSLATPNDPAQVDSIISTFKLPYDCSVSAAACFDSLPGTDGKRDMTKSTLVLKLAADAISSMHEALKMVGCTHTYDEFSPHVTLYYDLDKQLAQDACDVINRMLGEYKVNVRISSTYKSEIDTSWTQKIKHR